VERTPRAYACGRRVNCDRTTIDRKFARKQVRRKLEYSTRRAWY
jgi:hypothetical protein